MKFETAQALAKSYLAAYGVESEGLNPAGLGGARVAHLEVYFEFGSSIDPTSVLSMRAGPDPAPDSVLKARARIYTFTKPPSNALLDEIRRAAGDESVDTGGGVVEFMTENQGLFLTREYPDLVPAERFKEEIDYLLQASELWLEQVLEECLEKARSSS